MEDALFGTPALVYFWEIQPPPTPPFVGNVNVSFSFVFAYDSERDDYMLVSIVHVHGQNTSLVSVYQPSTRTLTTWNPISYAFPDPWQDYMPDGVFLNGFFYWIAIPTIQADQETIILRFDIASNGLIELGAPHSLRDPAQQESRHVVGTYDGRLCVYRSHHGERIDIVGMENGWGILRTIHTYRTDLRHFLPIRMRLHNFITLANMEEDLEEDQEFFLIDTSTLFRQAFPVPYEPVDRVSVIQDLAITNVQPYVATLVRLPTPDF
ncbi:uncharacterized protein LOC113281801 [Papaver somniferum]|uniref:uncharacterized protein LOC113281801 n=1 Tax=Papaver somniferum TaxID=3469 RepID=UPI000E6F77D3|nr:uncharacterized protein LOC113281801 [Papaver somniferum]XP_026386448.1 uncharacterized protein LOC113281801 [Papaver somniferum]